MLVDIGERVLLVASSHTGNNIFCTPAIRLLKKHYPDTTFDLVALNRVSSEVFHGNMDIGNLYITNSKRTIKKLSKDYSTVICMNYKSRDILPDIETNLISIPPLIAGMHHAEQLLQFIANYIGCKLTEADRAYTLGSIANSNSPILNKAAFGTNDILICIHLGCQRTAIHGWKFFYKHRATHQKLWPVDKYIALGNQLMQANPNIRIVITGTKHESFLGKKFERNVPGTINLIGKTSVSELFKLMNEVDLFISQDCGVLHIASASDVPLVGLFGPTNPAETGPYPLKKNHTVIKKESMEEINISEVVCAALNRLE